MFAGLWVIIDGSMCMDGSHSSVLLFSQCAAAMCVSVCVCNEAKEKSFVMPSDSIAPSTRLKHPEHSREGLGRGEGGGDD